MERVVGVNLGNWLVLEKWMHPDLFAGTTARDEDELCRQLPREELLRRLSAHRMRYITREDFRSIKAHGMNAVRIPVPHFIFGDDPAFCDPYVPCVEELDRAFDWADQTGLMVLIDLHTAPESQNGFDNGGICGVCKWAQSPARIDRVLQVLEQLAQRYGQRDSLWGIELINEPVSEAVWQGIQERYPPHDPARAQGSDFVPLAVLRDFYRRGYAAVRRHMGPEKAVVIHDGFRFDAWRDFLADGENVVLDAHWYLGMAGDPTLTAADYMHRILAEHVDRLRAATLPVIMGEWCLAHRAPEGLAPRERALLYRLIADAQLIAWESCLGHFFWSYKLISQPDGWDLRRCIDRGWLPENLAFASKEEVP